MLQINNQVRTLDKSIANLILEYQGGYGYSTSLFLPTESNIQDMYARIASLRETVQQAQLDSFWQTHFESVLRGFNHAIREHTYYPYNYIHSIAGFLAGAINNGQSEQSQAEQIASKLTKLPAVLVEVVRLLQNLTDIKRKQVLNSANAILKVMERVDRHFASSEQAELNSVLKDARNALNKTLADVESLAPAQSPDKPADFHTIMQDSMQVPLDFILSWYQDDYEQRFEEFRELAAKIDTGDPFEVLKKHSPSYTNANDLFTDAKSIFSQMRTFAQTYVNLPEDELCEIGPVPEQSKLDCPTAMYTGANVWTGKTKGMMGLNEDNFSAFNRAGLWGSIAHECYPGHHTNYVKAATVNLPFTFKIRLPLVRSLVEGVAHRSETLMAPHYENDVARLATAKRVLYCAARVKAEVDLNYLGKTPDEIIRMYREDMRINEMSARLQVQAHLMYPGDAVSYYTGARVLESRRKELGIDPVAFTEPIFSFGFVALKTMENIVGLSSDSWEALKNFHLND